MNRICTLIALCSLLAPLAARAQTVPDGVHYVAASPQVNATAEKNLHAALSGAEYSLAGMGAQVEARMLMVGPFLSAELTQQGVLKREGLARIDNRIPLDQETLASMPGVGVRNPAEFKLLDAALGKWLKRGGVPVIRKLKPEEMALIWYWIGWDITEPVFAVEQGGRTLVVDFQDDGRSIFWLEDITSPCMHLKWESGELPGCYCAVTKGAGKQIGVGFEEKSAMSGCSTATPQSAK